MWKTDTERQRARKNLKTKVGNKINYMREIDNEIQIQKEEKHIQWRAETNQGEKTKENPEIHRGGDVRRHKEKREDKREVISPMSVFFFLWSFSTSGCAYPQASPPLEFTVLWACLLIKHMWTCRGMGRDRGLRTASLCIPAHIHTCRGTNPFIRTFTG